MENIHANELLPATTSNNNNKSEVPPSNEKELALLHQNAVADGRMKLYALVQDLEEKTEQFVKIITQTKTINKISRNPLSKNGYETVEKFITAVDKIIDFYEAEMKNQLDSMEQKEQERRADAEALQVQVNTASMERDSLKSEVQNKDHEIARLSETSSTLAKDYEDKVKALEEKLGQMEAVEVEMKNRLDSMEQKEQERDAAAEALQVQVNTVSIERDSLKLEVQKKDHEIARMASTMEKDYKAKVKALEEKLGQMEADEVEMKNRLNSMEQKEQERRAAAEALKAQANSARFERDSLKLEGEEKDEEIAHWKQKCERNVPNRAAESFELQQKIADLQKQIRETAQNHAKKLDENKHTIYTLERKVADDEFNHALEIQVLRNENEKLKNSARLQRG